MSSELLSNEEAWCLRKGRLKKRSQRALRVVTIPAKALVGAKASGRFCKATSKWQETLTLIFSQKSIHRTPPNEPMDRTVKGGLSRTMKVAVVMRMRQYLQELL